MIGKEGIRVDLKPPTGSLDWLLLLIRYVTAGRHMNVRLISIALAAMLLAGPGKTLAQGIYAGIGVGPVHIDDEELGADFPLGRRLLVGFETGKTLAFEAMFLQSNFTEEDTRLANPPRMRFSGVAVYATGSMPAARVGRFTARLGAFTGKRQIISSLRPGVDSTGGLAVGIGYALDLNRNFALRADFDTFLQPEFESLSNFSIGLQLRFGD